MRYFWLAIAVGLPLLNAEIAAALPAQVFTPYLDRIRQTLPPTVSMRLPEAILLGGPGLEPEALTQLNIEILPTQSPPRLTIGLLTCERSTTPCLIGSFVAESAASINAQRQLQQHQQNGVPITLAPGIQGFLREGNRMSPPSEFSSVMWQQDDALHTISFLAAERQNLLFMAASMARREPIRSLHAAPNSIDKF